MKNFYLLCTVAGAVIPFVPFVSWVGDHGFDPGGAWRTDWWRHGSLNIYSTAYIEVNR